MKRLAVYFFWDVDGIVRDFVTFYIQALKEVTSEVVVVINGELTEDSHQKIARVSDRVIYRENQGFDVWAYKEALDTVGWDHLRNYDELILCNYTCYGPVYPFSEMFNTMQERTCDFWGVAKHPEQPNYLLPNKKGYIYEHIMSYFLVVRQKMLTSEDFKNYWNNVPPISSKTESTALHETVFTKHFEDLGYQSDAFVDLAHYQGRCYNASIILANELLIKDRCPLVKRRAFFFPHYDNLLEISSVDQAPKTLRFIQEHTSYDVNLIWDDILETQKMSAVKKHLHLNYVVPDFHIQKAEKPLDSVKFSFVIYIPKESYIDIFYQYLSQIPENVPILFLYSSKEIMDKAIEKNPMCSSIKHRTISVETNYDVSISCLNASRDFLENSDYCCCIWDMNIVEQKLSITEEDYCNHICQSLFSNEDYIQNLLFRFEEEKRLGIIIPLQAEFSIYFSWSLAHHTLRINQYKALFQQLNLTVPFDEGLFSNLETAFWIRGTTAKKILKLLDAKARSEIFAQKQVFNYFLPMLVQQSGYYTASATTPTIAAITLDNHHYVKNRMIPTIFNKLNFFTWTARDLENGFRNFSTNRPDNIDELLQRKLPLRHLVRLCLQYPKNKMSNIMDRLRKVKPTIYASLVNLSVEGEHIVFYFNSISPQSDTYFLLIGGKQYFAKQSLTSAQAGLKDYLESEYATYATFYEIPIEDIENQMIEMLTLDYQNVWIDWSCVISYNALELKEKGLFVRISSGRLYVQHKKPYCKSIFCSKDYGIKDKLLFLFTLLNKYHPLTIFSENLGAADNAFQLFQYAIKNGEQAYFIASHKVRDSVKDDLLRKRILVNNGKKHCVAMLFSKRWITSFSLRLELFPTNGFFKDIHYFMLPTEWDFVPHGIAVGDKEVSMLHKYSWDNPARTFVSTKAEQDIFTNKYEFKNVGSLGSPRMDKWYVSSLDENKVFIFFTWRLSLSKRIANQSDQELEEIFKHSSYYHIIVDTIKCIRKEFPTRQLFYAFHHEVVKRGYHVIIEESLAGEDIHFIYLDSIDGSEQFNRYFRESKYLITDFSSVAYDFAYKKNAIPIYFLPESFIEGHYTLEPKFFEINLGVITCTVTEILDALRLIIPTEEMLARRQKFFSYFDQNNSQRVYEAIFAQNKPATFLPTSTAQISYIQKPEEDIKRLGIYFFYDGDGIVDDYVTYYLTELRPRCTELCVVVNGKVTDEGKALLESCCDRFLLRKNIGFDSWAYKEALESYGFDFIAENFDEVLLNNFTNYGPIYPFSEMFDTMAARKCDFWGHNRYLGHNSSLAGIQIVDHLQSYFIVFRQSILKDSCFKEYWEQLLLPQNYHQAVAYHELRCTRYFESRGFISDAYIPWRLFLDFHTNTPVFFAYTQMVRDRSPLLKRKAFFVKGNQFEFPLHEEHSPYDIIEFISQNTNYDTNLIWNNLERTMDICAEEEVTNVKRRKQILLKFRFGLKLSKRLKLIREINASFSADKLRQLCQNGKAHV